MVEYVAQLESQLSQFWWPIEIVERIVVADALYDLTDPRNVVWKFSAFDLVAKQAAQDPPKVFMPRIGKKTSRIGEHSDKAA